MLKSLCAVYPKGRGQKKTGLCGKNSQTGVGGLTQTHLLMSTYQVIFGMPKWIWGVFLGARSEKKTGLCGKNMTHTGEKAQIPSLPYTRTKIEYTNEDAHRVEVLQIQPVRLHLHSSR